MRTITQTILFKNATPEALFDIYMDAKKHGKIIGAQVKISRKGGAPFSAFDGFVTGRNLLIVPNRLIVQTWRGSVWEKKDADSILILSFEETKQGAQIHLMHSGLPPQFEERWDELYWKPMQKHFRGLKKVQKR